MLINVGKLFHFDNDVRAFTVAVASQNDGFSLVIHFFEVDDQRHPKRIPHCIVAAFVALQHEASHDHVPGRRIVKNEIESERFIKINQRAFAHSLRTCALNRPQTLSHI